jgi:hypothetical protein
MGFSVSSTRLALILALLLACVPPIACQAPYWTQIGADFDGQALTNKQCCSTYGYSQSGEALGSSVSLSADGSRAAFASTYGGANSETTGLVKLYDYDGSDWTPMGTIEGKEDTPGSSAFLVVNQVSLSSDGTRVAVAQRYYPARGLVRVFEYSGSSWVQVGADLLGDADGSGDQSGASVSLSSDGSRIAIGALFNDGETSGVQNSNHGHVRVFEYDESSSSWMKVGGTCDQDFRCTGDIDGEAAMDESGTAVSLSGDGSRVAIGAPENDGAGLSAGHVRVFEYDGSTWTQIGQDIDGGGPDNRAGRFVSLSADGSRVAIGANDYGGTDMSGHVRVYEYDGSSWVLMGSGIDGVKAGDYSCVVSLSSDGSRVAIGALYRDTRPEVPGPVRVFEYDGSDWVQLGFGLYGDANDIEAYDSLAVSLSGDGSRLAVGASPTTIGALTDAGRVRVFELFRPAEQPGWIFELVPTYSGIGQFSGAATAGDGRVVFAPANADHVGVYDPTDDSFTMVPFGVTGDPLIGMNGKFNGAVTAGDGRVVFVPSNANGVGVFNPTDDSFTLVPVGVTGDNKFNGAAVAGDGKVVFAPENADQRGRVRSDGSDGQQFFVGGHQRHDQHGLQICRRRDGARREGGVRTFVRPRRWYFRLDSPGWKSVYVGARRQTAKRQFRWRRSGGRWQSGVPPYRGRRGGGVRSDGRYFHVRGHQPHDRTVSFRRDVGRRQGGIRPLY